MSNFFAPKFEGFTKYDAFHSHIFDYACLGRKACCYQRGSKLWKNCFHHLKTCLKMAGGRMHPPIPPGTAPARTDNNVSYHYYNQPMMWGKFRHSYFERTECTAVAQFGHFRPTIKTRVRFQKGGFRPPKPSLGVLLCLRRKAYCYRKGLKLWKN